VIALYEAAPAGWEHLADGTMRLEHDSKAMGWYAFAGLERLVRRNCG